MTYHEAVNNDQLVHAGVSMKLPPETIIALMAERHERIMEILQNIMSSKPMVHLIQADGTIAHLEIK